MKNGGKNKCCIYNFVQCTYKSGLFILYTAAVVRTNTVGYFVFQQKFL